jgi:hypothetical protein
VPPSAEQRAALSATLATGKLPALEAIGIRHEHEHAQQPPPPPQQQQQQQEGNEDDEEGEEEEEDGM